MGKVNFLSQEGLNFYSQELLDNYLLPYKFTSCGSELKNKGEKKNLRDGHIEREIHGAMHAARVCAFVQILHELLKSQFPEYVNKKISALTNKYNLSEEELILLTRYVALGHDCARDMEGLDSCETKSGQILNKFFNKNNIAKKTAESFAELIDHKNDYEPLKNLDLEYLRILLWLADQFDNIRIELEFNFSDINNKLLHTIPNYSSSLHGDLFFNFAKYVFVLLRDQHDLYYEATLVDHNGKKYEILKNKDDYSVHKKLQFEHAENILSTTIAKMQEYSYFQNHLKNEFISSPKKSEVKPIFNPFIHATTSMVLGMMSKTHYQLISPVEMLKKFSIVPFGGEIDGGGLDLPEATSKPCFAPLLANENSNEYDLDKIINTYSKIPNQLLNLETIENDLNHHLTYGRKALYSNINIIMIYMMRYAQLGGDLSKLNTFNFKLFDPEKDKIPYNEIGITIIDSKDVAFIFTAGIASGDSVIDMVYKSEIPNYDYNTPFTLNTINNHKDDIIRAIRNHDFRRINIAPPIQDLVADIESTTQLFYLYLFLAHYIKPDYDTIASLSKDEKSLLCDAIYTHCKNEKLLKKIKQSNLDLKALYANPTKENCELIINKLLTLPKHSIVEVGFLCHQLPVTLEVTNPFLVDCSFSKPPKKSEIQENLNYIFRNIDGHGINNLLERFIKKTYTAGDFLAIEEKILEHINLLESKAAMIKQLINTPANIMSFTEDDEDLITDPFPLLFLYNNYDDMRLVHFSTQEYRAKRPLRLGVDLTMLATDTPENLIRLNNYLERHLKPALFANMKLFLFADLKLSKQTGIDPLPREEEFTFQM